MQASLGLGQSLKESLAKVHELSGGEPAHDTLLRSAIPFVAALAETDEEANKVCSIDRERGTGGGIGETA